MTKGVKTLLIIFFVISALSIASTYFKYFILEDIDTYYDDYGESEIEMEIEIAE
jgi:hypothetical protein